MPGINEGKATILRELLGLISSGFHCACAGGAPDSFVPLLLQKQSSPLLVHLLLPSSLLS